MTQTTARDGRASIQQHHKYQRCRDDLCNTGKGAMPCYGHSMAGIIEHRSRVEFEARNEYQPGDIVFCKVKNRYIDAHFVRAVRRDGWRVLYRIENGSGWVNGWTPEIYGKAVAATGPDGVRRVFK